MNATYETKQRNTVQITEQVIITDGLDARRLYDVRLAVENFITLFRIKFKQV